MAIPSSVLQRPEHHVLLACARRAHSPALQQKWSALLQGPLDWDYLWPRLAQHGLMPLFAHYERGHQANLPPAQRKNLEAQSTRGLQQRLTMLAELQGVARTLAARDLPFLAYKGPVTAHAAYGSLSLRPFCDLDLIINPAQREAVVAALEENGYERERGAMLPASLERAAQGRYYEMSLLPQTGIATLDVHWAVTPPYDFFALSFEQLWKRRVPVEFAPGLWAPSREDLVLCAGIHGLKHVWNRLEWIGCLLGILESAPALDWEYLERTAQTLGHQRTLYLALHLADDLASANSPSGAPIPEKLRRAMRRDVVAARLAQQVWTTLFRDPAPHSETFISLPALLFCARARTGWRARWSYLCAVTNAFLVPEPDAAAASGRPLAALYARRVGQLIARRMQRLVVQRRI